MSQYAYPIRLQPEIVYPDVDSIISDTLDAAETEFRGLPAICEMLMQRLGDGAIPAGNVFEQNIGAPFPGKAYNDEALDRSIYEFKAELDPILVRDRHVSFVIPELKDILATEIQDAIRNGFPLLDAQRPSASGAIANDALIVMGDGTRPSQGGLSGYLGAVMQDVTVGVQRVQKSLNLSDDVMNAMQYVTPFIELAIQVVLQIANAIISVVAGTVSGIAAGVGVGVAASAAASAAVSTAMSAISAALAASVAGIIAAIAIQLLMNIVQSVMKCIAMEAARRRMVRAFAALAKQVIASMADMIAKVNDSVVEQKTNTAEALASFRETIGEMVARVQRGEKIIGIVNCLADGTMVIEFGIDTRALAASPASGVTGSTAGSGTGVALALVAGAVLLRSAR